MHKDNIDIVHAFSSLLEKLPLDSLSSTNYTHGPILRLHWSHNGNRDKFKKKFWEQVEKIIVGNNGVNIALLRKILMTMIDEEDLKQLFIYLKESNIISTKLASFIGDSLENSICNSYDYGKERKTEFERKEAHWHYIPFNRIKFYALLEKLTGKFKNNKHFIDVGAGIGDKLLLAYLSNKFDTVSGIEYNEFSYNMSIHLLHIFKDINLIKGDALLQDYSDYDFIYMFVPMQYRRHMLKLFDRVFKTAPNGALIMDVAGLGQRFLSSVLDISKISNKWGDIKVNYSYVIRKINNERAEPVNLGLGRIYGY